MNKIYWVARNIDGSLNIFNSIPFDDGSNWLISPSETKVCYVIPVTKLEDANAFNNIGFRGAAMFSHDYILKATGIRLSEVINEL